jgi:hypothetical protein
MFTRPWIFTSNPFQSVTNGSYVLAFTLSTYLDASLFAAKSDAAILVLYNYYHPIHVAFVNAYNLWAAQQGTQKGSTQSLKNTLDALTAKVNLWDAQVQIVYAKNSPQYIAIFPNGHTPFIQGKQTQRISAVETLDNALTGIVPLAATKTDVHNYAILIDTTNTTQKGNKTITNTNSDMLEAQRLIMCNAQMYVYGGLVQKFSSQLDRAGDFFDLEIMRQAKQTFFTNTVGGEHTINVFQRTLKNNSIIEIANKGSDELSFFLSDKKAGVIGNTFVNVAPNSNLDVELSTMGDATTLHFLNVHNASPNAVTFEVKIN